MVPVDLFGRCADYDALLPLCAAYGVPVLEDAAEALGAGYGGRPAGSFGGRRCSRSTATRSLTTSGGGMLLSDDGGLVARCRYLVDPGAGRRSSHYEHADIGYNYRLSNVLAALGRAQLCRLDEMIDRRRRLRERYAKVFAGWDGVRLLGDERRREQLLADRGGGGSRRGPAGGPAIWPRTWPRTTSRPGRCSQPLHLQPVYAGADAVLTGAAQRLFDTGLVLPAARR